MSRADKDSWVATLDLIGGRNRPQDQTEVVENADVDRSERNLGGHVGWGAVRKWNANWTQRRLAGDVVNGESPIPNRTPGGQLAGPIRAPSPVAWPGRVVRRQRVSRRRPEEPELAELSSPAPPPLSPRLSLSLSIEPKWVRFNSLGWPPAS